VNVAAGALSLSGVIAQSLTITPEARYTAVYAAAQNPELEVDCTVIEMRHSDVPVRSNFGEAVWFHSPCLSKEDA
jgi:hypothetical protein